MLTILTLHLVVVWLIIFKLKLVSGTLARVGSTGGVNVFPAQISLPEDINREQLRLGMAGNATVFADNAGVIGLIISILVWISSYTAYL